ncbi:MAG: calponin homology domain-containing protein, partial [archaeon]|nr:calponin homology domain-containing protein [archaeon]
MTSRGGGAGNSASQAERDLGYFGLDAELRRERLGKFEKDKKDHRVREWLVARLGMEAVGQRLGPAPERKDYEGQEDPFAFVVARLQALHKGLKDGILLCRLVNSLKEGACKRVNEPCKNVLQERENVAAWIGALEDLRVRPEERCTPADLHSGRDMVAVVDCLLALRRVAEEGKGSYDPHRGSLNTPLAIQEDCGPAVNMADEEYASRGFYGMGAEVQQRLDKKFDQERTDAALTWIRRVSGVNVRKMEQLADGVALCKTINVIRPGLISKKIHTGSRIKMMHRENVQLYLEACSRLGLAAHELFSVTDLTEAKYPMGVVDNIFSLGRYLPSSFRGARLDVSHGSSRIRSLSGKDLSHTVIDQAAQPSAVDPEAVDLSLDLPTSPRLPTNPTSPRKPDVSHAVVRISRDRATPKRSLLTDTSFFSDPSA